LPHRSPFGALSAEAGAPSLVAPSLRREASALSRLAPGLPDAPPAPLRVSDLDLSRGVAPKIDVATDLLADAQMGGVTKAENMLDGPSDDLSASPRSVRAAANLLDGPADPVDSAALAYQPAPAAGAMAPNGKPRIYDASAGTALDPLLDKSWDLNSAKTVDTSSPSGKNGK
jgi:UPF0755 protein